MDWQKLEYRHGSYTFSPTRSGSWNYDAIYETCLKEGITFLACLKTLPTWMANSYLDSLQDLANNPVFYGKNSLSVFDTSRYRGDEINQVKIGLGFI